MLLRQLILQQAVRNLSTTFQTYKCGLNSDGSPQSNALTILIFWIQKLFEEAPIFRHQNLQISVSAANHTLTSITDCLKCVLTEDFVPAIKLLT